MVTLLFLVATFVPLTLLEKWIHRHLHGLALLISQHRQVALYLYAVLLFPGVALHELAHLAMAALLGVRIVRIKLLPERGRDGHVSLGSIEVANPDAVRASLIGVAPLLAGSLAVLAIGYGAFDAPLTGQALFSGDAGLMTEAVGRLLQTPDMGMWLYLLFAVANAMFPSPSDRQTWPPVVLFLVVAGVVGYLAMGAGVMAGVAAVLEAGLRWLAIAFAITLVADMPFVGLIALAEWGMSRLRGIQVDYGR